MSRLACHSTTISNQKRSSIQESYIDLEGLWSKVIKLRQNLIIMTRIALNYEFFEVMVKMLACSSIMQFYLVEFKLLHIKQFAKELSSLLFLSESASVDLFPGLPNRLRKIQLLYIKQQGCLSTHRWRMVNFLNRYGILSDGSSYLLYYLNIGKERISLHL